MVAAAGVCTVESCSTGARGLLVFRGIPKLHGAVRRMPMALQALARSFWIHTNQEIGCDQLAMNMVAVACAFINFNWKLFIVYLFFP